MAIYITALMSILNSTGFKGSKILLALYALQHGATPIAIGLLISTYAIFPMLVVVHAGRIVDRSGVRAPMIAMSVVMCAGLLLPLIPDSMLVLFVTAAVLGTANTLFHVCAQMVVGSLGEGAQRTANFSTFSLAGATSAVSGPVIAGVGVDTIGYGPTWVVLAVLALLPALILLRHGRLIPATLAVKNESAPKGNIGELLGRRGLRNTLIVSGLVLTGLDLFNFYMPIYGRSIGMQATLIGIIVGTQGAAAFVVRIWMPWLVRRMGEQRVLVYSLVVAGSTFFLFPLFHNAAALIAIAFLLGLGLGCGQPLSTLMTYNKSPAGRIAEGLSLRLAVNKGTQISVPLVFGSLGTAFGVFPIFWCTAALLLAGSYLTARQTDD